ncbi:diguanylate cyclase [Thermosipho ferrireducens]|uniref:Diguanylate cyclase n=2 Tax=Thermosipho ferrireducens TaxID=2571116 RepID=A0ABX7S7X7_9BACT|nr:sensor domain-containing diguanylate cyclase [Thermosipho ferrireducens]QTA37383.1 diguanylate cyclase [Thermosipho ferrireducens]
MEINGEYKKKINIAYLDSYILYLLESSKKVGIDIKIKLFPHKKPEKVPDNLYKIWKVARYYSNSQDVHFVDRVEEQMVRLKIGEFDYKIDYTNLKRDFIEIVYNLMLAMPESFKRRIFDFHVNAVKAAHLLKNASIVLNYALHPQADLNTVIYSILTGITAGYSGAFNRAFLFYKVDETNYRLFKALGPGDRKEAYGIWEAIETIEYDIQDFLKTVNSDFIPTVELKYKNVFIESHEITDLLATETSIIIPLSDIPSSLKDDLEITTDIAFMPVRSGNDVLGFIIADNKFDEKDIKNFQVEALNFFGMQLAMLMENKKFLLRLKTYAMYDGLTGLENRRSLEEFIRRGFKRRSLIIFIDMNDFKKVNDKRGHKEGDRILSAFGDIVKKNIRSHDRAFRYGGDEFVIVILSDDEKAGVSVLRRIAAEAEKMLGITFSAGIVPYPFNNHDLRKVLEIADQLAYKSKKTGHFEIYKTLV